MEMLDISKFGILVHMDQKRGMYYVKSIITDESGKEHVELYIKHKNNTIVPLDSVVLAGGNFNHCVHGSMHTYILERYFTRHYSVVPDPLADFILKLN
jgi:hypothetical protein